MRRRIRHASSTTRRAPDPSFTGERQQSILSAILAVKPQETPRENSAIQKSPEFFFHESRNGTIALLLPGEKGLELFGNDAVQQTCCRIARGVFTGGGGHARYKQGLSQL